MDTVTTVAKCLNKIFELRAAIRHQRHVNKKTYLRLTEIFVEIQVLKRDGSIQENAMLRRTAIFQKFEAAALKFVKYLQKYNDMHRIVRIFKISEMEEQRLEVVDEVDQLFRMLGLATCATVIKGADTTDKNATKFLAKLEKVHADVKLTHQQVQAALLELVERRAARRKSMRQPVITQTIVIREGAQAPQESVAVPTAVALVTPESEVVTNAAIAINTNNVPAEPVSATSTREPVPIPIAVAEAVGENAAVSFEPEPFQTAAIDTTDVSAEISQEPVLEPSTSGDVGLFSPELYQTAVIDTAEINPTAAISQESVPEPSTFDEEGETKATASLELKHFEDADIDIHKGKEKVSAGQIPVLKTPADDVVEDKPSKTQPSLSDSTSVLQLVNSLKSCQLGAHDTEMTVLLLIRMCVSSSNRVQVFKTGGIPMLSRLVRESERYFTQLYALHCLGWFTFSYSKMREAEFEDLQNLVQEAPRREMLRLQRDLEHGDEQDKDIAVIRCSCMATRGDVDSLRCAGILPPLVGLLRDGADNQKLWAAEALATLASNNDQNCVEIAREGAIPPLVTLLRSGTDVHKQEAAYALGILAADNDVNRSKIAREGAIPPMVAFVKAVTDAQNQWAVYALGCLCLNNEANRIAIGEEDTIPSLVGLVRVGTKAQKQWAAYTLGNLALNDLNRMKITMEGAIKPLVVLLRKGTDAQKRWAAYALGNLSCDNNDPCTAMELKEAVMPLVELVRTGSDLYKQTAAYTLGDLAANNDDIRGEIGREGAILPLVVLLRTGTDEQKECAAYALGCLADHNDANRAAINEAGTIELLEAYLQTGTEDLKSQAERALGYLRVVRRSEFLPSQFISPVMGFFRDGVNAQKPKVAAALENVRDSAIPLLQKLVTPSSDTPQKLKSVQSKMHFDDAPVDSRAGQNFQNVADAA
ncbi:hypothetical protein PRIC2_004168 [Phytophthora ramorum]